MAMSGISQLAEPVELVQIPIELVDHCWPSAWPFLSAVRARTGGSGPEEFYARLRAGKCDLWCIYDRGEMIAAGITSVRADRLFIEAIGGRHMHRWLHTIEQLADYAKRLGKKTDIEIDGRPGWARVLAPFGFSVRRVVLGRTL